MPRICFKSQARDEHHQHPWWSKHPGYLQPQLSSPRQRTQTSSHTAAEGEEKQSAATSTVLLFPPQEQESRASSQRNNVPYIEWIRTVHDKGGRFKKRKKEKKVLECCQNEGRSLRDRDDAQSVEFTVIDRARRASQS